MQNEKKLFIFVIYIIEKTERFDFPKTTAMIKENLVKTIEKSLLENKSLPALSDYQGKTLHYQELTEEIIRVHKLLEKCGIKKGDKISLIGKNSANWAALFLGTITYGAVIVPILPDFIKEDIHNIVNHSDSLLLFSSDTILNTIELSEMKNLLAVFSVNSLDLVKNNNIEGIEEFMKSSEFKDTRKDAGEFYEGKRRFDEIGNDQLAEISYTSGTTGFSKGVMLTHNSLMANVRFAQENMPLNAGDRIVSFLPLAHSYGCAFEFLFPVTLGCHITFLTKTPSPQIIMQAFKEIKPNLILSVPLVVEKIYKKQILPVIGKQPVKTLIKIPGINQLILKKIKKKLVGVFGGEFRELVIGGAAFNPDAEKFFKKIGFPFTVGYGMTECGPLISYSSHKDTKLASAGKLVDTLELKIDSEDPFNKVGEIMVRGENVMEGYYKNEAQTKKTIDEEGWLHTGDLGVTDKDNNIFIKGRSKSLILGPSGQNIYPEEIEARLNNMYLVQESLVVDKEEKLIALVYPDFESMKNLGISEEELQKIMVEHRKKLNRELPQYMNIKEFRFHDQEFEKTPKKSIKRFLYS
jgi:long-chain acyl-CoA synthetase